MKARTISIVVTTLLLGCRTADIPFRNNSISRHEILSSEQVERGRLVRINDACFQEADVNDDAILDQSEAAAYQHAHRSQLYDLIRSQCPHFPSAALDSLNIRELEVTYLSYFQEKR